MGDRCSALNNNPTVVSFRNRRINYNRGIYCGFIRGNKKGLVSISGGKG